MKTSIRQTSLVFRREFAALLMSPLFYVITGVFFILTALIYLETLLQFAQGGEDATVNITDSVIRPTFHSLHFFLLVQIPLLTMRVFAEDQSTGMLDLMQTTPIRDWSLLLGKFLGTLLAISIYILLTAAFPITTSILATVEWPVVIGSFIALFLAAAAYTAVGMFYSSITESQVVAAVLSYVTLFVLAFGSFIVEGWRYAPLQQAARHFTVSEHVTEILSGNIAPMNIVYFIVVCAGFLFFAARILETRRWRA